MTTTASTNPTSQPASKWNNLFILPIVLGAAIIVVLVLISCKLKDSTSRRSSHVRQPTCDRKKAVHPGSYKQAVLSLQDSNMSNRTTLAPPVKLQGPLGHNYESMYRSKPQDYISNNSRGTRTRERAKRTSSKTRQGQIVRNGHNVTKRNRLPYQKTQVKRSNKPPYRQIQRTSAGYPAFIGSPAYRVYPGYLSSAAYNGYQFHGYSGYPTGARPPIISYMDNRGYMGRKY